MTKTEMKKLIWKHLLDHARSEVLKDAIYGICNSKYQQKTAYTALSETVTHLQWRARNAPHPKRKGR